MVAAIPPGGLAEVGSSGAGIISESKCCERALKLNKGRKASASQSRLH